jgi:hypothetical protein
MNPMPDVLALSLSFGFLLFWYKYVATSRHSYLIFSAILLSLSISIKLPFIILGALPFIYFLLNLKNQSQVKNIIIAYSGSLILPFMWYGIVMQSSGTNTVIGGILNTPITWKEFYDVLKYHLDTWWLPSIIGYYMILFFGVGVVFFFLSKKFIKSAFLPLIVYFIFAIFYYFYEFSIIVKVHDYYLFPLLPAITLITAYGLHTFTLYAKSYSYLFMLLIIILPFNAAERMNCLWDSRFAYNSTLLLKERNFFRKLLADKGDIIIINDMSSSVVPYMLNKKAYIFYDDHLPPDWEKELIEKRKVNFMFSNSRIIDTSQDFQKFIDTILYSKEEIKIIKLKDPIYQN